MAAKRSKFWSVLQTDFKSEGLARRSVLTLGTVECPYLYYCGEPVRESRSARMSRPRLPIFEGYLLVRFCRRLGWDGVESCKGVRGLLRHAGSVEPCVVGDADAKQILDLVDVESGYVVIGRHEPPAFSLAESVRAMAGAFQGQLGEFRGRVPKTNHNSMVAFQLLGREILSTISSYDLARA